MTKDIILHRMDSQRQDGKNRYTPNRKRRFDSTSILSQEAINACFDFAYDMTFGGKGQHRENRTGGLAIRNNYSIFLDAFHGKLCEFAVLEHLKNEGIEISPPDLQPYAKGEWDCIDFTVEGFNVAVKSSKYFANLLLLETADWDMNGKYIPTPDYNVDFFILVRLKDPVITNPSSFNRNDVPIEELRRTLGWNPQFYYDFGGVISAEHLNVMITNNFVIKQGDSLASTIMDADNYYCQTGDMDTINDFICYILNNRGY